MPNVIVDLKYRLYRIKKLCYKILDRKSVVATAIIDPFTFCLLCSIYIILHSTLITRSYFYFNFNFASHKKAANTLLYTVLFYA